MKTVNSISGGKTSSYLAKHYPADYEVFSLVCIDDVKCKPKDKSIINYVNAKLEKYQEIYGEFIATAEDDKTIHLMRDLEQILGRDIIWVRGISFDKLIDTSKSNWLPSWARRYCTQEMKMQPIFDWWFHNIGDKVNMRIGFRFDEYDRMERFFNNSDPTNFKIPISCKTYGSKQQVHQTFNWRYVSFPLIKNGITKKDIDDYWSKNGIVKGNLFLEERQIEFPIISNCVGCFHKKAEIISAMGQINPEKLQWFANQETKGKGTWMDNKITYQELIDNPEKYAKEVLFELQSLGQSCDSGGCND